jgi:intracellular septation protein A
VRELSDKEPDKIIDAELATHPEIDRFWMDYGKGIVNNTLTHLDNRAKNMITICASLIVVNFGLLLAFKIEAIPIKVTPQIFFAISAALFVVSYFPVKKEFHLDGPDSIEASYGSWMRWKLKYQRYGFFSFIVGLFVIAITGLL